MAGQIQVKYIYQGEDKVINFEIYKADGSPENLGALHNIGVLLIDSAGTVLEKYAMNAAVGFNTTDFDVVAPLLGQFKINVRRSVTLTACTGDLKFEINVAENDADFTDAKKYNIAQENIFYVKQSKSGRLAI